MLSHDGGYVLFIIEDWRTYYYSPSFSMFVGHHLCLSNMFVIEIFILDNHNMSASVFTVGVDYKNLFIKIGG